MMVQFSAGKWLVFSCIIVSFACVSRKNQRLPSTALLKFDLGMSNPMPGYTAVTIASRYSDEIGYGFEMPASVRAGGKLEGNGEEDFIASDEPFYFSVKLPEGNYNVRLMIGDPSGTSDLAIRAECRRMFAERVTTKTGELKTLEFTVHIRDTIIRPTGRRVRIKERERSFLHWDGKLTLEFNGREPKISTIEIAPAAPDVTNVFLAGNSTVVDQDKEPYAAWGQMIPAFFEPGKVAVANYAESGESLSSFIAARRFEKVLSLMKKGDYAFVEFGHNDQKQKGEGIGAFTSYKKNLEFFISEVRKKGGVPVLVTSMHRRNFDSSGKINQTLGDYPEAVRQTAKEQGTTLIDLNAQSKILYEAWGPVESKKGFVIYPANTFKGQKTALEDNTHFNPYGAYEIARIIATGIRQSVPGLARFLKKEVQPFNPAAPDPADGFYWPLSPSMATVKPDGS